MRKGMMGNREQASGCGGHVKTFDRGMNFTRRSLATRLNIGSYLGTNSSCTGNGGAGNSTKKYSAPKKQMSKRNSGVREAGNSSSSAVQPAVREYP